MSMSNEMVPAGAPQMQRKIVYTVVEKGDKSYWTRIGAAFTNRDGSLTVRLDALPLNGTLQIREDSFANGKQAGGGQ